MFKICEYNCYLYMTKLETNTQFQIKCDLPTLVFVTTLNKIVKIND